jgi:hypothetical protein
VTETKRPARPWRTSTKHEPPSLTGEIAPPDPTVNVTELVRHRSDTDEALGRFVKALKLGDRIARDAASGGLYGRLMDAAQGQPGAQAYDGPPRAGGIRTEPWCFEHETDHAVVVDGVRMYDPCPHTEQVAVRSDPTGNAAARADRARVLVTEVQTEMASVVRSVRRIMDIYESVVPRPADPIDSRKAMAANRKDECCASCARVPGPSGAPFWSPVHATSTVKGNLDEDTALCHWCWTWVSDYGELPAVAVLTIHARGDTVRRPATEGA